MEYSDKSMRLSDSAALPDDAGAESTAPIIADAELNAMHETASSSVRKSAGLLFLPLLIFGLITAAVELLTFLICLPLGGALWSVYNAYSLKCVNDDETPGFKSFKAAFARRHVICGVIYRLMTIAGTLLFIIPAIFIRLNFGMYSMVIADDNYNDLTKPSDIFAKSLELMRGNRRSYLKLCLYLLPALVITVLTLGIISPWSIPYIYDMKARFYNKIINKDDDDSNK